MIPGTVRVWRAGQINARNGGNDRGIEMKTALDYRRQRGPLFLLTSVIGFPLAGVLLRRPTPVLADFLPTDISSGL